MTRPRRLSLLIISTSALTIVLIASLALLSGGDPITIAVMIALTPIVLLNTMPFDIWKEFIPWPPSIWSAAFATIITVIAGCYLWADKRRSHAELRCSAEHVAEDEYRVATALAERLRAEDVPPERREDIARFIEEARIRYATRDVLPEDVEVISAFGALREGQSEAGARVIRELPSVTCAEEATANFEKMRALYGLRPESQLPYPARRIQQALENALAVVDDEGLRETYKVSLLFLREFVPDGEIPADRHERVREWARRVRQS